MNSIPWRWQAVTSGDKLFGIKIYSANGQPKRSAWSAFSQFLLILPSHFLVDGLDGGGTIALRLFFHFVPRSQPGSATYRGASWKYTLFGMGNGRVARKDAQFLNLVQCRQAIITTFNSFQIRMKSKIKIVVTSPEEVLKARFIPCLCSETQFLFQNAKVLLNALFWLPWKH